MESDSKQLGNRQRPALFGPITVVKPAPLPMPFRHVEAPTTTLPAAWRILVTHKAVILTSVLILGAVAAIYTFRVKPVYKAVARVSVEADTPQIQSITDMYQKSGTDDEFLETQIQVVKSDTLAWRTIEELQLENNPGFIVPSNAREASGDNRKAALIEAFKKSLDVTLVPKTRMLEVSFESTDPKLAAEVATTLVNNYVDYNFREKYDATRQVSGWLEQQLDELKAKVETSQHALVDYQRQNSMALPGRVDGSVQTQNVTEQMLSDLSRELTNARADRIQKEARYEQVQRDPAELAALADDDLLKQLQAKGADLKNQLVEAQNQYGPTFPKVERLQQQVSENQNEIAREQQRVIRRIHQDYLASIGREHLAENAVGRQRADLSRVNDRMVQYNLLQGEFETNQKLYQNLLQRLKDATVSAGLRSTNIHIVDRALAPTKAVRPRPVLYIMFGMLAGMVLGVVVAFAKEGLDTTVKSVEDLERITPIPMIGILPKELDRSNGRSQRAVAGELHSGLSMVVATKPGSQLAEAYRSLRTSILLATEPPRLLLITSTCAGEGKTTTSLNLAQAFAQRKAGSSVVLVDCDMRNGSIARNLKIVGGKGLSQVLSGKARIEEALHPYRTELLPNLSIITAGPVPPNPAELLSSDAMLILCEQLKERFDHIILDSPPVLAVTDAVILAQLADGVVVVAAPGLTPRWGLTRVCRILEASGARMIGVVFNKFDSRKHGYGSYGSYAYGSYGYGADRPN